LLHTLVVIGYSLYHSESSAKPSVRHPKASSRSKDFYQRPSGAAALSVRPSFKKIFFSDAGINAALQRPPPAKQRVQENMLKNQSRIFRTGNQDELLLPSKAALIQPPLFISSNYPLNCLFSEQLNGSKPLVFTGFSGFDLKM